MFALKGAGLARAGDDPPPPLSVAQAADQDAAAIIQQFSEIRVGITKAPGNGHQACAVMVMKRLRELGFNGYFEVFYDPAVKAKLEFLLPGFKPEGPAVQTLTGLGRLTVVEWKEGWLRGSSTGLDAQATAAGKKHMALGIMGGDDLTITPEQLNVDGLIRVQPTGYAAGTIALQGQIPDILKRLGSAEHLLTHVKTIEFSSAKELLQKEMGQTPKYKRPDKVSVTLSEAKKYFETKLKIDSAPRAGHYLQEKLIILMEVR